MNHCSQPPRFNVEEWLKSIDIWDDKYDYVMHNEHWLTSKWEPDCKDCRASDMKPKLTKTTSTPIQVNSTNATAMTTSKNHATIEKLKASNQDLIDLNETFDLYRSALFDTPQLTAICQTPGRNQRLLLDYIQEHEQQQQQRQQQQHHLQQSQQRQQQPQTGGSSRIPKIPVRSSNIFSSSAKFVQDGEKHN